MKGSLIGQAGLAGGNISFDRKMSAFQIGTNASLYGTSGTFGASGWFMYDILSHPTGLNFKEDCGADINLFLSGGNLTSTQAAECGKVCAGSPVVLNANAVGGKPNYTYNWSNNLGAGQTKTVNPTGTTTISGIFDIVGSAWDSLWAKITASTTNVISMSTTTSELTSTVNGKVATTTVNTASSTNIQIAEGLYVRSAGTQSLPNGVHSIITDLTSVVRNDFGASSLSGGAFTVPVGKDGWYNLSAQNFQQTALKT